MQDFLESRKLAIEGLRREGILKSPDVVRAMLTVPREEFLPPEMRSDAYIDSPLPIGFGQTTSALHMTALFCEYGEMKLGQRVLEVGGGCGYMSCVYAEVVAPLDQPKQSWGHVWSVELIPGLADFGRKNVECLEYSERVTFIEADASDGLEGEDSFDLIIVTSAAPEIPPKLLSQLSSGGILLIPVGGRLFHQELVRVKKTSDGGLLRENLGGVAFVPLRGKRGWKH